MTTRTNLRGGGVYTKQEISLREDNGVVVKLPNKTNKTKKFK